MNIKFVKASMEVEEADALVIEKLDIDKDHMINEEEFVAGFEKWLSSTSAPAPVSDSESQEDIYQVSIFSIPFVQIPKNYQLLVVVLHLLLVKSENGKLTLFHCA